jgi:uncharacterized protein (DUF2141 family)
MTGRKVSPPKKRLPPPKSCPLRAVFEGLGAGTYAIAAYHDEDNDDKFDRFLLILREGYGFSNDVRPGLRAPAFDEAAFNVPPGGIAVSFAFSGAT